ncbi:MAG: hypothetical protein H0Z33_16815 [Bacillaceae bacterium]|nr:hypothetical protein [Bacillaceae bacterium]
MIEKQNDKSKITHKELLTFSNLTNLEWQFVDLLGEKKNDLGLEETKSNKLKDLLKPGSFVRKDENQERKTCGNCGRDIKKDLEKCNFCDGKKFITIWDETFIYGSEGKKNRTQDVRKGLEEMKKASGIGMEYLEKIGYGKEGKFLKDWEVVYAADNYKLITEVLGNIYNDRIKNGTLYNEMHR